jgi:hypothetical protein
MEDPTPRNAEATDVPEKAMRFPGQDQPGDTPGAAGHPEPGSGHDDSETTTVEEGPPRKIVEGVPGSRSQTDPPRQP